MAFWQKSIVWRLLLPIPLILACILLLGGTLPERIRSQVVSAAIENSTATVEQFKILRGYYTSSRYCAATTPGISSPRSSRAKG